MNTQSAEAKGSVGDHGGLAGAPPHQAWIEITRALALVLVAAGHTERGFAAAGIMPVATANGFERAIYGLHIPPFFVITGLLFSQSIRQSVVTAPGVANV